MEYVTYAGIVLLVTSAAIVAVKQSRLWLAIWLFYVVSLVPMLGIVQVGAQWSADRYSYLPSLGVALLWGYGSVQVVVTLLSRTHKRWASLVVLIVVLQVVFLMTLTHRQILVWRTTETLTTRIIRQIPLHTEAPYYTRAKYRNEIGAYHLALLDIDMSLRIARLYDQKKKYPELYIAKAHILNNLGRTGEALDHANLAVETSLGDPPAIYVVFRNRLATQLSSEHAGP
jgi:hypothetical protein